MSCKKTTNRDQFAKIVDIMKKNADIAKNMTSKPPENVKSFWSQLKCDLDSLGPPVKDVSEWKKVWSDFKSSIRKKLALQNKENRSTGGGPNKKIVFSSLEEDVINLISLRQCTIGLENSYSFGLSPNPEDCQLEPREIESVITNGENDGNGASEDAEHRQTPVRRKRRSELIETGGDFRNKALKVVENQTVAQTQFNDQIVAVVEKSHASVEKMESTLHKIYRAQQLGNDLMKQHLEETIRHNKEMENLILKKLALKEKILEMQVRSIENQMD